MKMKHYIAVAAICLMATNSVNASLVLVPSAFEDSVPNSGNDFNTSLTSLGFDSILSGQIKATSAGTVTFYYHASESGWNNQFLANGSVLHTETGNTPWDTAGLLIGSIAVSAGEVLNLAFDSNNGPLHSIGTAEFGIFANLAGGTFLSNGRAYFGHDDNGAGPDDNHDDIVISASFTNGGGAIVPEPGTAMVWGLLSLTGLIYIRRKI